MSDASKLIAEQARRIEAAHGRMMRSEDWTTDLFVQQIPADLPPQPWHYTRWTVYNSLRSNLLDDIDDDQALAEQRAAVDAAIVEWLQNDAPLSASPPAPLSAAELDFRTAALAMGAISEGTAQAVDRLVELRRLRVHLDSAVAIAYGIPIRFLRSPAAWTGADMIEPETDTDLSSPASHASHASDQDGDSLTLAFARVRAIESFATKVSMRLSYLGNCCRDADMDRARLFYRCAAIVRDEADLE